MRRLALVLALVATGGLTLALASAQTDDTEQGKKLARIAALEHARDPAVKELAADPLQPVRRAAARALGRIAAPGDEVATAESGRITQVLIRRLAVETAPAVRLELIQALGEAGTPEGAAALVKIRDTDPNAKSPKEAIAAATALRFCAHEEHRAALVAGLGHRHTAVRRESALALAIIQREPRGPLSIVDSATRAALLRRMGTADRMVDDELQAFVCALSALKDNIPYSRGVLASVLARSEDEDVRAEAARGLARSAIGPVASADAPEALYGDVKDARTAVEIVHALAKHTKDAKAREAVVAALTSSAFFHARRAAAEALASGPPGENDPEIAALTKALADPYETVRGAALVALATRSPLVALDRAKVFLGDASAQRRMAAVSALGKLGGTKATEGEASALIEKLARDEKDIRVREVAVAELAHDPGEKVTALLVEIASTAKDTGVLGAAVEVLLEHADEAGVEEALAAVYERTRDEREHMEMREGVLTGLAKRGARLGEKGRKAIEHARTDPLPSVAAAAARAAAALAGGPVPKGPPLAHPALAVVVRDFADKTPVLFVETSRGKFEVELYPEDAPVHVSNVVALAEKKFYDGLTWHRVVSNFVVQGGCPRGDGSGDPGYTIPDELNARPYVRGTLGMPKTAQKDTGGCQLFFTHGRVPHLDGHYTVFGQIRSGVDVIDLLEEGDRIVSITVQLEAR